MPATSIELPTYFLDRYEVTVAEYAACVAAGACRRSPPKYANFSEPNQPVTGPDWFDAVSFCKWNGKHLPSEAEWEKAARGADGEIHPWGNEPADCARAVIEGPTGRSCGARNGDPKLRGVGKTLAVGSRSPGRYGIYDLAGNAEEWVYDWYTPSWRECGAACTGVAPLGPCAGATSCTGFTMRGVRGGSWYWPASHATGYHRRPHYPNNRGPYHHFGFRCAASTAEAEKLGR